MVHVRVSAGFSVRSRNNSAGVQVVAPLLRIVTVAVKTWPVRTVGGAVCATNNALFACGTTVTTTFGVGAPKKATASWTICHWQS